MSWRGSARLHPRLVVGIALAGLFGGCSAMPPASSGARDLAAEVALLEMPEVDYPTRTPADALAAEAPAPSEQPPLGPSPAPAPVPQPAPAPSTATPAPAPIPQEPTEGEVIAALVADLARYTNLTGDDVRREINTVTQALARQRSDANRVRLAMLYTLAHSPQDDQRALQLLEVVAKANPGSPAIKALAGVIQVQIVERLRAVREEQQKADVAIQKLEQLRVLERSLLRDRLRSGGGGGGGGSAGGGGGR